MVYRSTTEDSIKGCANHRSDYWEEPNNLTSEAFAHMFEAQFDTVRYAEMKKFFPKSLNYFEKMLERI